MFPLDDDDDEPRFLNSEETKPTLDKINFVGLKRKIRSFNPEKWCKEGLKLIVHYHKHAKPSNKKDRKWVLIRWIQDGCQARAIR